MEKIDEKRMLDMWKTKDDAFENTHTHIFGSMVFLFLYRYTAVNDQRRLRSFES